MIPASLWRSPLVGGERAQGGIGWSVFALFATYFAWHLIPNVALPLRFEDQMIVLRYARNLAEGNGLVYNLGERVMGFTTPLYTLLTAIFVRLAGDAAPAWQNVLGVLCLLATAGVSARFLVRIGAAPAAVLVVPLLTFNPAGALSYLFVTMEVHLFALFFVLAIDLYVSGRPTAAAVVSALLFLTRPEGMLLTACLLGDQWAREKRLPVRQAASALFVVAPWLLFAWVYYGSVFPSTLAATAGALFSPDTVIAYLGQVGATYGEAASSLLSTYVSPVNSGLFAAAGFVLAALLSVGAIAACRPASRAWPIIGVPVAVVVGLALIGAWPGFTWHYYSLSTAGAIVLALGAQSAVERFVRGLLLPTGAERLRSTAVWVGLALLAVPVIKDTHGQIRFHGGSSERRQSLELLGGELATRFDQGTTILVDEIGYIGWYSRLQIIDRAGLVTPGLRYDVTRKEAVRRHEPDLMLLHVDDPERRGGRNGGEFPFGYELVDLDYSELSYRLYAKPGRAAPVPRNALP